LKETSPITSRSAGRLVVHWWLCSSKRRASHQFLYFGKHTIFIAPMMWSLCAWAYLLCTNMA
jgi:hypothetical protein